MIDDVFGHQWVLTRTLVDTAPEGVARPSHPADHWRIEVAATG
jgi:hypothetical protein